ncbi:MATE family efflux transporter [Halomonas campisalis]|uniref:MATE family efflux transporter n=1 Tax=Billgrantia campisalis TaxID=74661 RepID=A0ABS9P575_9GAMM|nr:MATE family efflux transporter [Halomonas campisalis]MCG6656938.1 MATE family efflux transporter [Halomonas campisalis]MDR5862126.1 MATE family efflux transporter [Halomonas campisalis]
MSVPTPPTSAAAPRRPVRRELLEGPIALTLLRKSLPVAAGMIAMLSFNLVDAWFIARLGTEPLAAVSFTFPVVFTVISLAIGLGIGTSAVVGRRLGQGDLDTVRRRATDAALLALAVGLGVSLLGLATLEPLFRLLGADAALMPHVRDYMGIWYLGAAMVIVPRVLNSVLRAQGNTLIPGLMMALAALLNGLLDWLLIFGKGPFPALGVQGAALATVLSWGLMTLALLWQRELRDCLDLRRMSGAELLASWRELSRIALPAAITSVFTPLAMAVLTRIVAGHGHPAVAAFGVGTRIDAIAQIAVLALSMTLPPLVSQNLGAGQPERVRRAILGCFLFVLVWQFGVWLLLQALAPWLVGSYAEGEAMAGVLRSFLWWVPLGLGAQGVVILAVSSLNALHEPARAMRLSVIRLFVLSVPLAWLGGWLIGTSGIFLGMLIANAVMAMLAWWQLRRRLDVIPVG